jgi:hypothetical protein
MNKRKLIRRVALIASVIFLLSILILILQIPYRNWQFKKHLKALDTHVQLVIQRSQTFLSVTSQKIKNLPVDPKIASEIQSQFLKEDNSLNQCLWVIDNNGEFIFGVPKTAVDLLNNAYDKYRDVIEKDGHYLSRNDFLSKLVHKHNKINFSEFEPSGRPEADKYEWRYYTESDPDPWRYVRSYYFQFSMPVVDDAGGYLGEIYLKVDDSQNKDIYSSKYSIEQGDLSELLIAIFATITFLSGLILWFLLPTWVYLDAHQRDVKNPGLWAFLTLVSLIFGLIIYLITRPQTIKTLNCPQCEKELNGTKAFCPYCGFDVSSTFCPQCQYPIKPDWSFCPSCRSEIRKQTSDSAE